MLISWYSRNSLNEGDEMIVRSKQQLGAKKLFQNTHRHLDILC